MRFNRFSIIGCAVLCVSLSATAAVGQVTVYNNFGPDHNGWDYNWGLGWTVAGENVPAQYGVEQAMGFTSDFTGTVSDIWVAMWYAPPDPQADIVTVRLAHNPNGLPPTPADVMEEWTITQFEPWTSWSPPHHLPGSGASQLEAGQSYWLWAIGGETTWCGWCMNIDPALTCPHTMRREGENWLPIANETASAFRVDIITSPPCPADINGDGMVNVLDLLAVLAAWGNTSGPEDVNGDGIVDVLDLLELLAAWGPC